MQGKCLNLGDQVSLFQRTARKHLPGHFNSSEYLSDYLSKSIFTFSIGSNDYISNYLEPDLFDTSRRYPPRLFSQILTGNLSHHLEVRTLSSCNARGKLRSTDWHDEIPLVSFTILSCYCVCREYMIWGEGSLLFSRLGQSGASRPSRGKQTTAGHVSRNRTGLFRCSIATSEQCL